MARIFLIFLIISNTLYAQINEDFSHDSLLNDGSWNGTTNFFIVNTSNQLQLNAPSDDADAWLFTNSKSIENALWQMDVKMGFNPSAQNYCRIFLAADSDNTSNVNNSYFLYFGGTNDEISLYKRTNGTDEILIDGFDGLLNNSSNDFTVKVTNDSNSRWQLDVYLNSEWHHQGSVVDTISFESSYFGLYCDYTSTRSTLFWFDNLVVSGDPYVDESPLTLQLFKLTDQNHLTLNFSKEIDSASVSETSFVFSPNDLKIDSIVAVGSRIELVFEDNLPIKSSYNLTITKLSDKYGLVLNDTLIKVENYVPERFDILFSEFITDPSPSVGLPETEFIEVYNNTQFNVSLDGYILNVSATDYPIKDAIIKPHQFAILTSETAKENWSDTINVIGLKYFPSLAKTSGQMILSANNGTVLDAIIYDEDWQKEMFKDDGGWSFEIIDLSNRSGDNENWAYSVNSDGGTPGHENSVNESKPDIDSPIVILLSVTDTSVQISFSEPIDLPDYDNMIQSLNFEPKLSVDTVLIESNFLNHIEIVYKQSLKEKQVYELTFNPSFSDFAENFLKEYIPLKFGKIEEMLSGDIIINEIMFNPVPEGVDFVEIYNKSDKILSLCDIYLTEMNGGIPVKLLQFSSISTPLFPKQYAVATSDSIVLKEMHHPASPFFVYEMAGFPSMPDDEGDIAIADNKGNVIDQLHYSDDWHYSLLNSNEGVSLERIHPGFETQTENSWHSASKSCNYATPTQENSQFALVDNASENLFALNKKTFTPDMDGYEDMLLVTVNSETLGGVLSMTIFDASGNEIIDIAQNQLLGTCDVITWDGTKSSGEMAPPGIYIVWGQVFYPNGKVVEKKETCVLSVSSR
ncbi:MAG: lamin tail domain-containing protein [Marinilabiliaceae bacterium]|nr:lamin tail domain-containing protein [Marinilabiliaceae bacterium]